MGENKDQNSGIAKKLTKSIVQSAMPIAFTQIGTLINPVAGGVIGGFLGSIVTALTDSGDKAIERRLNLLEARISDTELFLEQVRRLNEHDVYCFKNHLQFYLTMAVPEIAELSVEQLVQYIMQQSSRELHDTILSLLFQLTAADLKELQWIKKQIDEKFEGNYSRTYSWNEISRFRTTDESGQDIGMPMDRMATGVTVDATGDMTESSYNMSMATMSYKKLSDLGILILYHMNVLGMNPGFALNEFLVSAVGVEIMKVV